MTSAAVAARVFGRDIALFGRRLLSAGVRVGAAEIARERRGLTETTTTSGNSSEEAR
ncbi:hypothetical protein ACIRU3_44660 [Streptomyces sp. NPDC101151]|uniref:hypothetical protein n=1 Tax=Streptomyces sp. NPDC101151 TaxID=3366115 RepID=UPI00380587D1